MTLHSILVNKAAASGLYAKKFISQNNLGSDFFQSDPDLNDNEGNSSGTFNITPQPKIIRGRISGAPTFILKHGILD